MWRGSRRATILVMSQNSARPTPARAGAAAPAAAPSRAPAAVPWRAPAAGPPANAPAQRGSWPLIIAIACAAFAAEMAVSARYGYHRDELYFLQAGAHPAFGYVDQPPLTPMAARLANEVFGGTLAGLRVLPALLLALVTVLTAVMSRVLGAGRAGQVLAALAAATCAEYLGAMHLLTTTTLDYAFWALTLLLAVRLLASRDPRWWLAIGACVGAGAEAKWTVGVLGLALIAGFLATGDRSLLRSRYLLFGCLLAAALAAPDLVWQASHGWPNLAVFRALAQQAGHNRVVYWPAQILYTGFVLTPVWVAGLVWCLRSPAARRFRAAGIAAGACLAVFFALGGKPYYAGGAYTFLFAAGAVPVERWLAGGRRRATAMFAALAVSTAAAAPVALPVLPARWLHTVPLQKINYDLTETIAWPKLVALVAREYRALPPGARAATAILTGNYGEAGAIDRYGPADGLPPAFSGAHGFWYWGPPPARDRSALAVNVDPALLRRLFRTMREVATFHNGLGVADDEQGAPIYRATGLTGSWAIAWPLLRNFS